MLARQEMSKKKRKKINKSISRQLYIPTRTWRYTGSLDFQTECYADGIFRRFGRFAIVCGNVTVNVESKRSFETAELYPRIYLYISIYTYIYISV